ncbi:plant U-box 9 [Perilla frutescens var. frutescens]|nr:plant U-box 9 [Perilla frutescens var. frutescens]
MAKSGVFERDPVMVVKAVELKKELQKLLKAIVDEDDVNLEALDRAQQMLLALKELKLKNTADLKLRHQQTAPVPALVPEEFKCPLSKELMRDPVIVSTGKTYDRPFIQRWLKSGNRTCPETQQVLSYTSLTPNHLIRDMIMQWCKNHGIKLPESIKYNDEEGFTEADKDRFISLLMKMTCTLPQQKEAAKELRLLTKRTPSVRALFGESADAIPKLLAPLSQSKSDIKAYQDLQEDIIPTLLNVSIHDSNKKHVAETPTVIPILIDAVRSGTVETRSNAAAALFTLSALDSNKSLIGKSGAMKPLLDLLDEGHPLAMKDVASAIFSMCLLHENKVRAVRDGGVGVILKKIKSRMHVDELLAILAMLSTNQKAIEELIELAAVPCLFSIIRETSCARTKENCIAILHIVCFSDRSTWKEMREEENMHHTISELTQNGTSRAKRKANGILERLNKAVNLTHTA